MITLRGKCVDRLLGRYTGASFFPGVILLHTMSGVRTYRHEMWHQKQMRRYWVIGFWALYLYQRARYGYWNMPLEVEARKVAEQS